MSMSNIQAAITIPSFVGSDYFKFVILATVAPIIVATAVILKQAIFTGMEKAVGLLICVALLKMNVVIAHHGLSSTYNLQLLILWR